MSEQRSIFADLVLIAIVLALLAAGGVGVAVLVKYLVASQKKAIEPAPMPVAEDVQAPPSQAVEPSPPAALEPAPSQFRLVDLVDTHLPPPDAPMPWVTERIADVLQRLDIEADGVGITQVQRKLVRGRASDGIAGVGELFVQVTVQTNFDTMVKLIAALESQFPYMRIDGLLARRHGAEPLTRFQAYLVFPVLTPLAHEAVHEGSLPVFVAQPATDAGEGADPGGGRDPFALAQQPPGRTPPEPVRLSPPVTAQAPPPVMPAKLSELEVAALHKVLHLSGVVGNRAIIGGSIVQQGESFTAEARGHTYGVQLVRVLPDNRSVVLKVGTDELTVAMPGP